MARWQWILRQITKQLWYRASLFSLLGIVTALLALAFKQYIPDSLSETVGADAVDKILGIIASSMLAVTTFSLSTMVSAYSAASSGVTPRATTLVMEDTTTQNALATFIGSFLFSLVGIVALSTGLYGKQGRVLLFAVTLLVIAVVVYTLLRWIDHLSRLGRVGETIDRVEKATLKAMQDRLAWPYLGGAPYPQDAHVPALAMPIPSKSIGYIQHIDIRALGALSHEHELQIYVHALPGTFLETGRTLVSIVASDGSAIDDAMRQQVCDAFTIGVRRTFENDPRFGLAVLAEIASRALSPAVNDPGTAIDVIGRGIRTLSCWGAGRDEEDCTYEHCSKVYVPALQVADMFDDFFTPIARDGASLVEVGIRLQKALISLRSMHPDVFTDDAERHAGLALQRAELALALEEDKVLLRNVIRDAKT